MSARKSGDTSRKSLESGQPSSITPPNALYNFKLLAALRSDSPAQVQPFLDELGADSGKAAALLGMAVRVASVPIVQLILASPQISPNVRAGNGPTPLHVASEQGRADIVELLLSDPRINDTIRDEQGRTALECASSPEISRLIDRKSPNASLRESRTALQLQFLAKLAAYISSPLSSPEASASMLEFLDGPRTEILNLNALDEKSGTSLIHEAARRRDIRLVELAVKRGADVFIRDKRGKRVLEGEKAPDERIKAFLRQFNNQEALVASKSDGRPPDLKGFLSKWVNYRTGWRTRWFVLENGILSYYRTREDEPLACRGSISMAIANVSPSHDNSRFEIHSKVSSAVPKIIVKSSHRAEVARWVQAINLNIEYYKNKPTPSRSGTGSTRDSVAAVNALPAADSFLDPKLQRATTASLPGSSKRDPSPDGSLNTEGETETISFIEAADERSILEVSSTIPHESIDLMVIQIKTQLETTEQLVASLVTPPSSPGAQAMVRTDSRQAAVKQAIGQSLAQLSVLVSQYSVMAQDRERFLLNRVQREVDARKMWEENMLTVAQQQADMDRQLTEAAQHNEKKRKALRQAKEVLADLQIQGSLPTSPMSEEAPSPRALELPGGVAPSLATQQSFQSMRSHRQSISISNIQEVHAAIADAESSDDEDEEFFDAIETGTLPNLKLHESIAYPDNQRPGTPTSAAEPKTAGEMVSAPAVVKGTIKEYLARKSLEPYLGVRNRLPIDDDKRPSVSLWSILKSSVGKDLTKISFPVSFNECTSMLQRMAEDMEYDACLTVAASQEDSLKRLAFVAAFAMSNYSSTLGRIAKPFNPLLSQSFEYAIPGRYRYISEQVSHHPPMSACYCEAPTWKYFGEVDAQNKFQGRSFEIRPTGVAHAELILPSKFGPDYPKAGAEYGEGLVVEHYSWKKVTTNISNFIMGTPIIDHYGDLVVTNHRTGETCTLTFKPRTWRGKDAMEIKGVVQDARGRTAWDIAGKWDTQLIARQHGAGGPLEVDTDVNESGKEYLLLWRNSEKPPAPFNLTPYAVTLNDIPQGLEKYLAPTDCRLRTDQRAFENAEYDRAQELKSANEDNQRNTRKLRAEGRLPPHEARWFTQDIDADSGERVWWPKRSADGEVKFWHDREMAPETKWQEVDHIFVE